MKVTRGGQEFALPFTNPDRPGPGHQARSSGTAKASTPRVLLDFEQKLIDIVTKYRSTFDAAAARS